jgi:hypothetical protein
MNYYTKLGRRKTKLHILNRSSGSHLMASMGSELQVAPRVVHDLILKLHVVKHTGVGVSGFRVHHTTAVRIRVENFIHGT